MTERAWAGLGRKVLFGFSPAFAAEKHMNFDESDMAFQTPGR